MSRKALIVRIPPIDKDVWLPSNPGGRVIAMLMLEDLPLAAVTLRIADCGMRI